MKDKNGTHLHAPQSTHKKTQIKKHLACHCNHRKYRKATSGHQGRQSVLCSREAPLGESTSVWLSKLPRVILSMGVTGRAGAEARIGLEKSLRERSHRSQTRSRVLAARSSRPCKKPRLPTPRQASRDLSASPHNSQTWRQKGTGHIPGGTKEKPWIYTQSNEYHFGQVYLHQIPTKKQAVEFYKHSYPAQNERGMSAIARLWAASTTPLLSLSWGVIFLVCICDLDLAITPIPLKFALLWWNSQQQTHIPSRDTLVPVTQPVVVL